MANPKTLTVTEAVHNFSNLINRVHYQNARFILTKGGTPVAALEPLSEILSISLGEFKTLIAALPDLSHDEISAFATDMASFDDVLKPDTNAWDT